MLKVYTVSDMLFKYSLEHSGQVRISSTINQWLKENNLNRTELTEAIRLMSKEGFIEENTSISGGEYRTTVKGKDFAIKGGWETHSKEKERKEAEETEIKKLNRDLVNDQLNTNRINRIGTIAAVIISIASLIVAIIALKVSAN